MPLKGLKPRRSRVLMEHVKHLSLVRTEFVIDLGLLRGGEVKSLLAAPPSRKHLGTTLEAIKRHAKHSKSAAVAGTVHSTPGVDGRGPRAQPRPERPAERPAHLPTWPLAINPPPQLGVSHLLPSILRHPPSSDCQAARSWI